MSDQDASSDDEGQQQDFSRRRLGQETLEKATTSIEHEVEYEKYLRPVSHDDAAGVMNPHSKNKRLKRQLERRQETFKEAAVSAARAEILFQEQAGCLEAEGLEKTYRFKQETIQQHVDLNTSRKIFELDFDTFGPYSTSYSRTGRHLLLSGQKGHVAILDTLRLDLVREFHTEELTRDATFLHNYSMIAVAQKKFTFIYDSSGAEVHCIRDCARPATHLQFLPYHFLLVSAGKGFVRYQDTSTGKVAAQHSATRHGVTKSMTQNPWNAVIHVGDAKGIVSLWTPNMSSAVVKMVCHQGSVQAIAVDRTGTYMATAGADHQVKIWDVRTYQELHAYRTFTPATTLDISQTGMLGIGHGVHTEIWKDALSRKAQSPYMTEQLSSKRIETVRFQPYEDVLSVGHAKGIRNMVVPGAGEPNIDSYAANPYEDTKQRRETEVKALLDKLQPEMITLDPSSIGRVVSENSPTTQEPEEEAATPRQTVVKNKKRGRSKIGNKLRNKSVEAFNKHLAQKEKRIAQEVEDRGDQDQDESEEEPEPRTALSRFQ